MPHIPAVVIPSLLLAALFCGGFYAGAVFGRTGERRVPIILLAVLLVAVSLYAGFAAGGYMARLRADSLANNTLRTLSFALQNAQVMKTQYLQTGKIDQSEFNTLPKLPLGVYALHDDDGNRPLTSNPAVPVACIGTGYDADTFIVLLSDYSRERMTRTQLGELLGIKEYHTPYDLSGFRKRPHTAVVGER